MKIGFDAKRAYQNLTGLGNYSRDLIENSINEFEIAAADMKFFEANASVDSNRLILFSKNVNVPKYVKYAWSDTPHATLFNGDNFPASSFFLELK